jgi:hypothetical protein
MTPRLPKDLIESDLRNLLRKACEDAGSQQKWAKVNGFSSPFVSDVLHGRRAITDRIANALGYESVETFKRKM